MRSLIRRFALAALIAPAIAGFALTASPAEAAAAPVSAQTLQADVARLTNAQRVANGCKATTVSVQLTTAAADHSGWMAQTGTFSHTGKSGSTFVARAKTAGFARPSGENIAWGYRTASSVVTGWMQSPGHRANILNCKSTAMGVGVAFGANGNPYYTQVFGY